MVLAYHCIFATYGFWLPNDPRGSWSDWIRRPDLLRFGAATKTDARHSVARRDHDAAKRRNAKSALQSPVVVFNGHQALAVARGFARAIDESGYIIHACAILPQHVHLVIARHGERKVEQIVAHLKGRATQQLQSEGLHPLAAFADDERTMPSPWSQRSGWQVYLNNPAAISRAIQYVESNPSREGKRPQRWSFVTPYRAEV